MIGFGYDELLEMTEGWVEETNSTEYETQFPRFVRLAEIRLVRDLNLEIFDVVDPTPVVNAGQRAVTKPTGTISTRSLWLVRAGIRSPLLKRTRDFCAAYAPDPTVTSLSRYYFEADEDTWQLAGTPDVSGSVEAHIIKRPAGLTPANQHTWLGDNAGDALFSAILMESEHFTKADDRFEDMAKNYVSLLQTARMELRNLIRGGGEESPVKPTAEVAK